jgi:hypothetical protein
MATIYRVRHKSLHNFMRAYFLGRWLSIDIFFVHLQSANIFLSICLTTFVNRFLDGKIWSEMWSDLQTVNCKKLTTIFFNLEISNYCVRCKPLPHHSVERFTGVKIQKVPHPSKSTNAPKNSKDRISKKCWNFETSVRKKCRNVSRKAREEPGRLSK